MKETWILRKRSGKELAEKLGIHPVLARLIRARIPDEEAEVFLHRDGPLEDPFLMKDLRGAVEDLAACIQNGCRIYIVGDYDVDGVTAASILHLGLKNLGGESIVRIPDRTQDGYGIRPYMVDEALEQGCGLIMTCDNGIREFETMDYAAEMGMNVILTDHHEIAQDDNGKDILPKASWVINPHRADCTYPFSQLCGAGVAYKLMQGLHQHLGKKMPDTLLGYAALGTICDLMILTGENRRIVWQGLKIWNENPPAGIHAMMDVSGIRELTPYHCGFIIGPMINAGGRLKSQEQFIRILLTEDPTEAFNLACELKTLNEERQKMTLEGVAQAISEVDSRFGEDPVKVIRLKDVHESIAGLIAGKIKDHYYRPTIVFTGDGDVLKGSGRSIEGYDLFRALKEQDALLTRYGGHPMAAGLSISKEQVDAFRTAMNQCCQLQEGDFIPKIYVDAQLPIPNTSLELAEMMDLLEPFGNGNERPVFAAVGLKLTSIRILGRNQNVASLHLRDHGIRCEAILFRIEMLENVIRAKYGNEAWDRLRAGEEFRQGLDLDVLYHLGINSYRGARNVQCTVCNLR